MGFYQGRFAGIRGRGPRRIAVLTAAVAVAAVLAACSSPSSSGTATTAGTSAPSADQGSSALTAGTSADFPPMSFKDPTTGRIVGFDNDMMNYVAPKMGRTFAWQQLDFSGLIPALQSGRLSVIPGLYDTADREKVVTFVDYLKEPLAVMVLKTNLAAAKSPTALCGKTVAYLIGSSPESDQLTQWSQQCTSAGKPAITQRGYQTVAAAVADIANGRTFAELETDNVVLYVSQSQYGSKLGKGFVVPNGTSIAGIAVAKNSPLLPAIKKAVKDFIASPAYCTAAQKWGMTAGDLMRAC